MKMPIAIGADDERLKPSKRCFDDALEYLWEKGRQHHEETGRSANEFASDFRYRLIHAVCLTPLEGEAFAHAWVEEEGGDFVINSAVLDGQRIYLRTRKEDHYRKFRPYHITTYTIHDAFQMNELTSNYGPWKEVYLKLCSNYRPGMEHKTIEEGEG